MKKILTLILVGMMMLSLCSCDITNFVTMKGEEVELNYDTAKMEENKAKIEQNGLYVELLVTSYESGDKPETARMGYAKTEDMFYFVGDGMETYYDFTDDTKTVMYDKNEEGVWVRSEIIYEETGMTREQMEANCELQASAIFNYLGSYEQFNGQKVKKTTTTVAGRECDEFNISVGLLGYGMNYVFAVDPETGMCLKWSFSASAGMEGSASVSFTCNKFETPYTIKLPTNYVNAEDVENNGGEDNGNNYGDNGNENNGGGSTDNGNGSASGTDGKISVYGNGAIVIVDYDTVYHSDGYGILTIELCYSNGDIIEFEEERDFYQGTAVSAEEWGFSTTDTVCTLTIAGWTSNKYANVSQIEIRFEGITEEEFVFGIKDLKDITYTPVAGKEIKTAQGETIGGFTLNID